MSVSFKKNSITIEIHHASTPKYEDLFNLQSNLIRLMQMFDHSNQTQGMEIYTGLELLHETLIAPDQFKEVQKNLSL